MLVLQVQRTRSARADHIGLTPEQEQMLLELCRSMIPIIKKRSKIINRDCTLNCCPIPRKSFFSSLISSINYG